MRAALLMTGVFAVLASMLMSCAPSSQATHDAALYRIVYHQDRGREKQVGVLVPVSSAEEQVGWKEGLQRGVFFANAYCFDELSVTLGLKPIGAQRDLLSGGAWDPQLPVKISRAAAGEQWKGGLGFYWIVDRRTGAGFVWPAENFTPLDAHPLGSAVYFRSGEDVQRLREAGNVRLQVYGEKD